MMTATQGQCLVDNEFILYFQSLQSLFKLAQAKYKLATIIFILKYKQNVFAVVFFALNG